MVRNLHEERVGERERTRRHVDEILG
jgi:hypothetical protein